VVVVLLVGAVLAIPAWAASPGQADDSAPDTYAAMHETCEAGDVEGMAGAMGSLTEEEWRAMEGHMSDDHHENTETHMAEEDSHAMEEHVGDGHHGAMNGPTGGGMMQSAQGMMDWR